MPTAAADSVALFQAVLSRAPTTVPAQDVAIMTWHIWTSAPPHTSTGMGLVEGYFDTFFNAVKVFFPTYVTVDQYRWYALDASGRTQGAPLRVTDKNIVGTGTGSTVDMPPQVAMTVTEKSTSRRRWGRFYLPVGKMTLTTSGRFSATQIDIVADAAEILYNAINTDAGEGARQLNVVTKVRLDGTYELVNQIQIDDLVDVQRRRRWDAAALRDVRTLSL